MTIILLGYIIEKTGNLQHYDTFVILALFISFMVMISNGYLLSLHCYLMKHSISTYDFVTKRRKAKNNITPMHNLNDTNLNL